MTSPVLIGERVFSAADQERFAVFSGDVNPVHMPGRSAQRALAAVPVVHGIHTLLWSLDRLVADQSNLASVTSLKARFGCVVLSGAAVVLTKTLTAGDKIRLDVTTNGKPAAVIHLGFGGRPSHVAPVIASPLLQLLEPRVLGWDDMVGCCGRIRPPVSFAELSSAFPGAAAVLGQARVAGLCCSSAVVGMACPGLHSILGGLSLGAAINDESAAFSFAVNEAKEAFRLINVSVSGCGWIGTVDAIFDDRAEARNGA